MKGGNDRYIPWGGGGGGGYFSRMHMYTSVPSAYLQWWMRVIVLCKVMYGYGVTCMCM
jgi:hypothetical protein